jgi:hypothetical protein
VSTSVAEPPTLAFAWRSTTGTSTSSTEAADPSYPILDGFGQVASRRNEPGTVAIVEATAGN